MKACGAHSLAGCHSAPQQGLHRVQNRRTSKNDGPPQRSVLERMCCALEHRGQTPAAFTRRRRTAWVQRLRVIDLATGDQPIFNEDRSVAVVLNGEIYNYRELRADLERAGHRSRPAATPR